MSKEQKTVLRYLALGDSYTIGEQVAPELNFPHQLAGLLKRHSIQVSPVVIAKTGWTTDELAAAIHEAELDPPYDLVTLLVGVNNQYRGRSLNNYGDEFDSLLRQAIGFAGGHSSRVIVVSIPDWGVTPFAEGRDRGSIAAQIDAFNQANRSIAAKRGVHYIDITESTRLAKNDHSLLAGDLLHPSAKEYAKWAAQIAELTIRESLLN
jgi:lysophospholipase L1-like esterase